MTAHLAKVLESTSALAIEAATSQKISAVIIPFRAPVKQMEVIEDASPVEVERSETAGTAEIDNVPALPPGIALATGASAIVERNHFKRAVDIASEALEKRNSIPILSNVRVVGTGDAMIVTGTDLDVEIVVTVPAAADAHFNTTVPGDLLDKLLKKAVASDYVSLVTNEAACKLDFERANFNLQTLPAEDFPSLSMGDALNTFEMKGADFWAMVDGTIDAVSKEETRYYLNGIYLHTIENGNRRTIVTAATDGHRLYRQEFEMPFGADQMPGVIIPRKACDILYKLLKGKNQPETVTISVNDTKIRIAYDDIVITSKLVDGTFPDYARVVPQRNSKPAKVSAKAMIEAAESVSLVSGEKSRAVKLSFDEGHAFCLLEVNNPDSGRAEMSVPCQFTGDCLEIGFNARYLISALKDASVSCDDITLTLEDAGSPTNITSDREGWMSVLMPMRV